MRINDLCPVCGHNSLYAEDKTIICGFYGCPTRRPDGGYVSVLNYLKNVPEGQAWTWARGWLMRAADANNRVKEWEDGIREYRDNHYPLWDQFQKLFLLLDALRDTDADEAETSA